MKKSQTQSKKVVAKAAHEESSRKKSIKEKKLQKVENESQKAAAKKKLTHSYGCNRLADSASSPGVTQVPARNESRPLPPSEEPHTAPSLVV